MGEDTFFYPASEHLKSGAGCRFAFRVCYSMVCNYRRESAVIPRVARGPVSDACTGAGGDVVSSAWEIHNFYPATLPPPPPPPWPCTVCRAKTTRFLNNKSQLTLPPSSGRPSRFQLMTLIKIATRPVPSSGWKSVRHRLDAFPHLNRKRFVIFRAHAANYAGNLYTIKPPPPPPPPAPFPVCNGPPPVCSVRVVRTTEMRRPFRQPAGNGVATGTRGR